MEGEEERSIGLCAPGDSQAVSLAYYCLLMASLILQPSGASPDFLIVVVPE